MACAHNEPQAANSDSQRVPGKQAAAVQRLNLHTFIEAELTQAARFVGMQAVPRNRADPGWLAQWESVESRLVHLRTIISIDALGKGDVECGGLW